MDNLRQYNKRFVENRGNSVELGNNPASSLRYIQRTQVEMVGIKAATLDQRSLLFLGVGRCEAVVGLDALIE